MFHKCNQETWFILLTYPPIYTLYMYYNTMNSVLNKGLQIGVLFVICLLYILYSTVCWLCQKVCLSKNRTRGGKSTAGTLISCTAENDSGFSKLHMGRFYHWLKFWSENTSILRISAKILREDVLWFREYINIEDICWNITRRWCFSVIFSVSEFLHYSPEAAPGSG